MVPIRRTSRSVSCDDSNSHIHEQRSRFSVSSSMPIFSNPNPSDENERDVNAKDYNNNNNKRDYSEIREYVLSDIPIGSAEGGELYNFDDEELMEILSDIDNYGIGELDELEDILEEQLALEDGTGWMDDGPAPTQDSKLDAGVGIGVSGVSAEGGRNQSELFKFRSPLEEALLQGVVPAAAGVGSKCLPGDYGFDPLGFATKDYFKLVQNSLLRLVPPSPKEDGTDDGGERVYTDSSRPPALILRDYREAEIRHGRLAMLAAIIWPLQEIIDKYFLPTQFGETTIIYGGTTLPFLSLVMILFMLLLGYLDIYANAVKEEAAGDAFLPGDCFWDPLSMIEGVSDEFKNKMQLIELNNGRWAMVAVSSYIIQEAITHQPLITLPWNQVLFEPAFQIPAIQAWLDERYAGYSLDVVDAPLAEYLIENGAKVTTDTVINELSDTVINELSDTVINEVVQ